MDNDTWNISDMVNDTEQFHDIRFCFRDAENDYELMAKPTEDGDALILGGTFLYRDDWKVVFKNCPSILAVYDDLKNCQPHYNGIVRYIHTPIRVDSMDAAAKIASGNPLMTARKFKKVGGSDNGMEFHEWKLSQQGKTKAVDDYIKLEQRRLVDDIVLLYDHIATFRKQYGFNPVFNNKGAEYRQLHEFVRIMGVPLSEIEFQPDGGTTGKMDFKCAPLNIQWGELKATSGVGRNLTWTNLGSSEFNKQNENYGLDKLFNIDCLVHTSFDLDNEVHSTIIVIGKANMEKLHPLIKQKQEEALARQEEKRQADESIGRDGITITTADIVRLYDDSEIIIDYRGQRISKADFVSMLGTLRSKKEKKGEDPKIKTKLTPVRYPGGKSNALKQLAPKFPASFKEYREPFFGGGSVGLYLMQTHKKDTVYWINDLFHPVYCFWKTLRDHPDEMVRFIQMQKAPYILPNDVVGKKDKRGKKIPSESAKAGAAFHKFCREKIENTTDEFEIACLWYILNKLSYSGMAMIGSYAPLAWDQNFTDACIANLPATSKLMNSVLKVEITNEDYSKLLAPEGDDVFIFLDPPYKIPHSLYGNNGDMHEDFDHKKFADQVIQCKHNWMITYNQDPEIELWFAGYSQTPWDLTYTMKAAKRDTVDKADIKMIYKDGEEPEKSGKKGKELLILNYDNTPKN